MVYPNEINWKLKTCHFLQVNYNFDNDNFYVFISQGAVDFVKRWHYYSTPSYINFTDARNEANNRPFYDSIFIPSTALRWFEEIGQLTFDV